MNKNKISFGENPKLKIGMTCALFYMLGHLLITFACSSEPIRRGEYTAQLKRVARDILGILDWLFVDKPF
jgi:hypothetical protein